MLSRTASDLYWMARYLERAESFARVLDVTWKLSMMPRHRQQQHDLALPLNLTFSHELFQQRYARFSMNNLLNFFALDSHNPSSIYSCIEMAWNNAHAVRGSLSSEVWECINTTRIDIRNLRQSGVDKIGIDTFFDWVKERSHLFRGAMFGTLLRNDAQCFIRVGTLIERAYATAQLLALKDQQLNNDPDPVREYYRLDTLLRAVSAREAYHSIYRQPISRETVSELLVFRNDVPRSLHACMWRDLVQPAGADWQQRRGSPALSQYRPAGGDALQHLGKPDARRPAAVAGPFSQPHQRAGGEHQSHLSGGEMRLNIKH